MSELALTDRPQDAETAFVTIVTDCARDLDRHLAEFLETENPDGPHKTRVALRRLTTALDAFHPILRRSEANLMRRRAKDIFRRLGPVRDADVYHLSRGSIDAERLALREAVRAALRKRDALAFGPLMQGKLVEGTLLRTGATGQRLRAAPVTLLAGAAMNKAYAALGSHGKTLARMKDTARHEFRKDLKSLRYLTDFLDETEDAPSDDLAALQDMLGTLNDLANARAREKSSKTKRHSKVEVDALRQADVLWARLRKAAPWWPSS